MGFRIKPLQPIKLSVFDFDGTLINTPLPDLGRISYKEKTGIDWKYIGWWSKPESLDTSIFDMPIINEVIESYMLEIKKENTLVIMMTGRLPRLSGIVEKILDDNNLKFDEYIYNNGGSTDSSKIKSLNKLLDLYPSIKEIEQWDDRDDHIPIFKKFGDEMISNNKLLKFNINHVNQQK